MNSLWVEFIYVIRLAAAALCGALVGYERESKKKSAGLRTHVIVAVASATMMIISKYGFNDVLGEYIKLDPARVAAGVVTAVGFIGSGIIIFRNNSINGVTTSAGIWATVGVGMAMGSGMYILGVVSTIMVMLSELFLGRRGVFGNSSKGEREIEIEYYQKDKKESLIVIEDLLVSKGCYIDSLQLTEENNMCYLSMIVKNAERLNIPEITCELRDKIDIKKILI